MFVIGFVIFGKRTRNAFHFYADTGFDEFAGQGDDLASLQIHVAGYPRGFLVVSHREISLNVQRTAVPDSAAVTAGGVVRNGTVLDIHHRGAQGIGQCACTCCALVACKGAVRQGGYTATAVGFGVIDSTHVFGGVV